MRSAGKGRGAFTDFNSRSHTVPLELSVHDDLGTKSSNKITQIVGVIKNFLNYLIYHEVAPEYRKEIDVSKKLCAQAEDELWEIEQIKKVLPGEFNRACSRVFGGLYASLQPEAPQNGEERTGGESEQKKLRMSNAVDVFKTGFAARATQKQLHQYQDQSKAKAIEICTVEDCSIEVTGIKFAEPEICRGYKEGGSDNLKPVGLMSAKTWICPVGPAHDLTEEEEVDMRDRGVQIRNYEFWVEDEILKHCFLGMKLDVTVRTLSFGLSYFDAVSGIFCSFYQVIPNAMMDDWKKVESEWLPRRESCGAPLSKHTAAPMDGQEEALTAVQVGAD